MRRRQLLAAVWLSLLALAAKPPTTQTHLLDVRSPVQDKNFYVLSLMENDAAVARALIGDAALAKAFEQKRAALREAASSCTTVPCFDAAMHWQDAEIESVGEALKALYGTSMAVRSLADEPLRASHAYIRYESKGSAELLAQAWADAAHGMNRAIDTFGEGKPPRYAAIDSPAFDVTTKPYEQLVHTAAYFLVEQESDMKLFFQPTLRYALQLMEVNKRDEAGRLEPLEQKENAATVKKIRTIAWTKFPYTVIVVPGAGTDRLTWSLSPSGKLRTAMAARRWHEKKAPLILVSGGFVHPNQTPFSEAVEMKRALMAEFGVPEEAILIDPHARHTTTNLRNAARQMYRYGIPFERMALITTDSYQSAAIASDAFTKRCQTELGGVPYKLGKRLSLFDLEWLPQMDALQLDPVGDLLDP